MALYYRTSLLPHHYVWAFTEFLGWTMAGGLVSTLMHYPLAKYVVASPDTHAHIPVSKLVSAEER